jgi:hypothetical protein
MCLLAGRADHSRCDCFGVAVLTHGDDGVLYGTDDILPIDAFVQPIKGCASLAGKPKIFIFQVSWALLFTTITCFVLLD